MAIILNRLTATGPGKDNAEIVFDFQRQLIRGPSDTGKSYIRDCLWYLLGGDRIPKPIPEAEGYDALILEFRHGNDTYQVHRGLAGGGSAVYKLTTNLDGSRVSERLDVDEGDLLVQLSGASGRKILRSTSEKGGVTSGDLRHWSLLSQTAVISEEPTSGASHDKTQRIASFNLFLTGGDDAAIELRKSNAEVERIKGQLTSAEDGLKRIQAGLPQDVKRDDVADALARVDQSLSAMTSQYDARAATLREVRIAIAKTADQLIVAEARREHSAAMVERFELLDEKYASDLARLGATDEGIGVFQALPETACPLCGTPAEQQLDPQQLKPNAATKYRQAIAAEVGKIKALRKGLLASLEQEKNRLKEFLETIPQLKAEMDILENREAQQLTGARVEFAADPKTLAVRRSELSAQMAIFDEKERLEAEIDRLKKSKVRRRVEVIRDGGAPADAVAQYAKKLINDWGFTDVTSVGLDALECDLLINGRTRLSYGAGKRAVFLTALIIAMLSCGLEHGYPHLGVIVIDSPLKAYADPTAPEQRNVPVKTVTEKFYAWLSTWNGPGQIVILENEDIKDDTAVVLKPIQFTGINDEGRPGFYLKSIPRSTDRAEPAA